MCAADNTCVANTFYSHYCFLKSSVVPSDIHPNNLPGAVLDISGTCAGTAGLRTSISLTRAVARLIITYTGAVGVPCADYTVPVAYDNTACGTASYARFAKTDMGSSHEFLARVCANFFALQLATRSRALRPLTSRLAWRGALRQAVRCRGFTPYIRHDIDSHRQAVSERPLSPTPARRAAPNHRSTTGRRTPVLISPTPRPMRLTPASASKARPAPTSQLALPAVRFRALVAW